ncbi:MULTISPECIES: hypothetical protein [unclassified Rhodosalinus]|uniref:hypothetical protein n=1 Tax=unclassified Rhodosalinus TaxID=2630183 RepID=UPI0035241567
MALSRTHDLHKRRLGRNLGVGLALAALVIIVFAVTVAKVSEGEYEPPKLEEGYG